jgi:hypothetical protein
VLFLLVFFFQILKKFFKEILKTRYNKFTNSLDLSSFQSDSLFQKHNETPLGLIHNSVIVTIADYVSRHLTNIKGIRLNVFLKNFLILFSSC